ncbi:WD40 repeat [Macleaya cordata]|uniref:WD40 repeat n=1 Tax=Macleaya cordata TaxID=56857 RepID=A0A200Q1R1_MACCD|nr:WD40 repeat [Macleaya cordata]
MRKGKGSGRNNGLLPNSLRIISSCLKTVSSNATSVASTVRSAGASVAASISVAAEDRKDQILWAGFDKLELGPSTFKHVLLLGYSNGFQVLDAEDASNVSELVSKRDGPVTFLQIQPIPVKSGGYEGFGASHPLLLVVGGDETNSSGMVQGGAHTGGLIKDGNIEPQPGNCLASPTAVRFYSLSSHSYVHVLRFRSAIYMVRCSPHIVAVGLAAQIYCFDALTLENKFSVLTYPVPQVGVQGEFGVNVGYGPMAVGPRWLAYASNSPLLSNMGRLSPQILTPSPGVSPSTSPGNGSLVARYAMESSKHLAAGIINLGDMGYKTLSRYCQELLPDGSNSPVSSNSSWKVGRVGSAAHSTETDNAGMVVVKDFVSRAVISQFRAHTSPISALCFDPSGTLLVTASVHGNNINIFRIMPSSLKNGSGTTSYDWGSSHVHLYKLHRGMTTAVIQDICFSQYSQWAAIVSSRGTCHIFVLSPFGGDADFQTQSSHSDGPTLLPGVSLPWWSTSSFMINQQSFPPPPPVTLSVVCRIKNGNSGWLNTVSNAAASATGKVSVPSGAIAAAFHNSASRNLQSVPSKTNALEHLLVYTPSGHLVQHELVPSLGTEPSDSGLRTGSGPSVQIQDEELKVKGEPIQWWDVCRRSDWPEREESISKITLDRQTAADITMDMGDSEDNDVSSVESNSNLGWKDLAKPHERLHWYLSNAEVQISSGRIPIWQKSKISFYSMLPLRANERKCAQYDAGGEIEIEKVPSQEVEIRRKDLLPVFDHFHGIKSNWNDRGFVGGRYQSTSSSEPQGVKDKFTEETVFCHSKTSSLVSVESSDRVGSSRRTEGLFDLDQMYTVKSGEHVDQTMNEIGNARIGSTLASPLISQKSFSSRDYLSQLEHSDKFDSLVEESCVTNDLSSLKSNMVCVGRPIAEGDPSSNNHGIHEVSNASSNQLSSSPNILSEGAEPTNLHDQADFGLYFQEGYCKASELDECQELTGFVTDADSSSSHYEREKPEEDGDNGDMLGGIFAFSEEVSHCSSLFVQVDHYQLSQEEGYIENFLNASFTIQLQLKGNCFRRDPAWPSLFGENSVLCKNSVVKWC